MLLNDLYLKTIDKFKTKSFIDNPLLDARMLICHFFSLDNARFIIEKDTVSTTFIRRVLFNRLVKRRLNGESIAAIIGKKYFYDSEFVVNKHVLIPRPETELIIDLVLERLVKKDHYDILDIGTGSGNISIIIAKHLPNVCIDAIDINERSLKVAAVNLEKNSITPGQISLIKANILTFTSSKKYDVIISNPPYIKTDEVREILSNNAVSDPFVSLDGGKDGLNFYRKIRDFAEKKLKKDGFIFLEHGIGQRNDIINLFDTNKYTFEAFDDYALIDRVVVLKKRK